MTSIDKQDCATLSQENNTPNNQAIKEVALYDKSSNLTTTCRVCEFRCQIEPGNRGACRVRYNDNGVLRANNYGVVSRADIQLADQRHLYHLFPGAKIFSMGGYGQNFPPIDGQDQFDEVPPTGRVVTVERMIKFAIEQHCRGVIFDYNEPFMWYEYLHDASVSIKANGMFTAIVSNAYTTSEALEQVGHYIDGMLLELNAFNERTFMVLTGQAQFQKILEITNRFQRRYKGHIEVSTRLVPGVNDSDSELSTIAAWISRVLGENTAWHLSSALPDVEEADEAMIKAKRIGRDVGLRYVYLHGLHSPEPPLPPEIGGVPFDATANNDTYCYSCHQKVIERNGDNSYVVGLENSRCSNCNTDLGIRTTIWKL